MASSRTMQVGIAALAVSSIVGVTASDAVPKVGEFLRTVAHELQLFGADLGGGESGGETTPTTIPK